MIDVVFSTNEAFAQHCCVAITSLLLNNKNTKIRIHLLGVELEEDSVSLIGHQCKKLGADYDYIPLKQELFNGFPPTGIYSLACYSRLFIASLLPTLSKVLYLDCDMIVRSGIRELWEMPIEGFSLAGVPDTKMGIEKASRSLNFDFKEEYINSGMLLINLDYWRKNNIQQKFIDFLQSREKVNLPDQDTINYVLAGSIKIIHPRYNAQASYFVFPTPVPEGQKKYIKQLWKGAVITHFTGAVKPWHSDCVNPFKKEYWHYRSFTPYDCVKESTLSRKKQIKTVLLRSMRSTKGLIAKILSYTYS